MLIPIIIIIIVIAAAAFIRHQMRLKQRAFLMQEAIRNRDFQFRLSKRGLLWGECAMQEALNNMGQEVKRQIAESEVESWRKLTRVLTHEIMNATAPIASISQAFLQREDVKGQPIEEGIRAIHDTCDGLNSFVENYRKLTQLQMPQYSDVCLCGLVENVRSLYPALDWAVDVDESLVVEADKGLLSQVIINLAKNAIEAGAKRMGVCMQGGNLLVSNDGAPIPPDVRRDIFTPFFTTKWSGSGIGLSLSRQIMIMQEGDLALADKPAIGYHVTFVLSSSKWL